MKTINKVILVGHLVADPEVRETAKGDTVANLRVATDRNAGRGKDAPLAEDEEQKRVTADFHTVVAWDKLAEVARDHLKKGMAVYVEGRLQNRSYELPDQTRRFVTEIRLDTLSILSWKDRVGDREADTEAFSADTESAVDVG